MQNAQIRILYTAKPRYKILSRIYLSETRFPIYSVGNFVSYN